MAQAVRGAGSDIETRGRPALGTPALSLCEADCAKVVAESCRPPKDVGLPITNWSVSLLAEHLRQQGFDLSDSSVSRILCDASLQPHRQKMWMTSQDAEFRRKRDQVLRVYYRTPLDQHIVCLDEKPGIQILQRRHADIPMQPGQPVRREFEYIRHGTLCLMGGLDVRRGKLFGFLSQDHDASTFIDLLDLVDACYPSGRGHIVNDNLAMHDTPEVIEWFDEHPRWMQHFTPTHASWLNQIECAFSLVQRRLLARSSFSSIDEAVEAIYEHILWFNGRTEPFRWTYRPRSYKRNGGRISDGRH